MTREEIIKMRAYAIAEASVKAYNECPDIDTDSFELGAEWADEHPQGWISVEDELPKPNEFVLVYGKSDGYDSIEIDRMINNNKWEYMDEASHWTPLPELPKKGGEK